MPTDSKIMQQLREQAAKEKLYIEEENKKNALKNQQVTMRQHTSQARLAATEDFKSKQDAKSDKAWDFFLKFVEEKVLNTEQMGYHDWRACMSMILSSTIHLNEAVAESFKYKLYEIGSLFEKYFSEPLVVPLANKISDALSDAIKEKLPDNTPLVLDNVFHDVSIDNHGKLLVNLKFGQADAPQEAKTLFKNGIEEWLLSQGYHKAANGFVNNDNEILTNDHFKELMKNPETGFSAALEGRFDLYNHLHPQETPAPRM